MEESDADEWARYYYRNLYPGHRRPREYATPAPTAGLLRRSQTHTNLAMATAAPRMPDSPSSSPRLPSPPPMPEMQFGPQSPSTSANTNELQVDTQNKPDESARRRIRPGTRAADMARGPPLVPLIQLDSAFQLQEHLKALYAKYTHGQSATHTVPITRETASEIATPPQLNDGESVDKNLWLYELCRFLTMKAGMVAVKLMEDKPQPCSSATCPEMRASEWQYLCAVHEPPKSCCAIDYVNHTLDWAANVLTSTKHFPSRLQLGGESGNVFQSMRQLTNIFRRVYRIFAHAWFQHREVFWNIENTHGIYMLFKTVCDKYQLIPEDNYTVPPEAEGVPDEAETSVNASNPDMNPNMHILRKDDQQPSDQDPSATDASTIVSTAATTRRHKHTPSTGSHVGTIAEGAEEDDQPPVPALPSSSPPKHSSSPPKASSDRPTPQSLGRLDIANTVPSYVLSNPSDPTPTTATSDRDPMSAAKAFQSPEKGKENSSSSTSPERKAEKQPSPERKQDKTSPERPGSGNVSVKPRRDSGLESNVRSPTGGSFRTAGPDILSAVLGHMSDDDSDDDDDNDEGEEGEQRRTEGQDATSESVTSEDTAVFSPTDSSDAQAEVVITTTTSTDPLGSKDKDDKDDKDPQDDPETMEEIKLPEDRDRGSPSLSPNLATTTAGGDTSTSMSTSTEAGSQGPAARDENSKSDDDDDGGGGGKAE